MSSELDDELLELVGGGDKSSRKRNREGSSSAPGRTKKPSKKRKLADSDNEPESEEGDESDELYPLEGKYIDEEDRETLLGKTEIEREEILAARMDEIERIRDRKHVDKLRAQQLAGVAAVESEAKRPARASGKDKSKDRTLTALKAKRKAKDEKKRTRGAASPKPHERSSSPMDMDMSDSDDSDDEDGQISKLDQEDERLFGKPKPKPASSEPAVEQPLSTEHLAKIAFTRDTLAKHSTSPWFEKIVTGGWVRYLIGQQESHRVYRICQIIGLTPAPKGYKLADRTVHYMFELKHGQAEKAWQMDRTSNEPWTHEEFKRLTDTYAAQKIPLPTRKEVDERHQEMQELIAKQVTEADISEMISVRKRQLAAQGDMGATTMSVAERSRLTAARTLAQRRQDYDEVRAIDLQLGAAPAPAEDLPADRLALVNERNRRANAEAVRRAEMAEAERKKRERERRHRGEGGGELKVIDPSARLRTVPRLFESATPTSRPSTPNPATLGVAAQKQGLSPSPGPKASVNANGKTFEAAVIDAIEVDLGDF
ncbi:hypothetical protein B0H11DRAFT_2090227 [Mycena galericulata]|nr:hypothetical protein B0H11DRAFT_2090227 [Mycena galericulata]